MDGSKVRAYPVASFSLPPTSKVKGAEELPPAPAPTEAELAAKRAAALKKLNLAKCVFKFSVPSLFDSQREESEAVRPWFLLLVEKSYFFPKEGNAVPGHGKGQVRSAVI